MLCSLAVNDKSKAGFGVMIAVGAVLFVVGLVLLLLPVKSVDKPQPPSNLFTSVVPSAKAPSSMVEMAKPLGIFKSVDLAPSSSPSSTKPGIRWKGDDVLESVKEFKDSDAAQQVAHVPVQIQAAHEPKAVPALPVKRLVGRLGYESASVPALGNSQQVMADAFQTAAQTDSPLTGGYTRLSPLDDTVESRLRERQEFEAFRDSDTLDAQRHRRYALMREAAWSQPLVSRDGLIPILGPDGEDLTQGRCNSIVANSV